MSLCVSEDATKEAVNLFQKATLSNVKTVASMYHMPATSPYQDEPTELPLTAHKIGVDRMVFAIHQAAEAATQEPRT